MSENTETLLRTQGGFLFFNLANPGGGLLPPPCDQATVLNTDLIVITQFGVTDGDLLRLDIGNAGFSPGKTLEPGGDSEIEIEASGLSAIHIVGGSGDEFMRVARAPGNELRFDLTGDDGLALGDVDVKIAGMVPNDRPVLVGLLGNGGNDTLENRNLVPGQPLATVGFDGGGGDDTIRLPGLALLEPGNDTYASTEPPNGSVTLPDGLPSSQLSATLQIAQPDLLFDMSDPGAPGTNDGLGGQDTFEPSIGAAGVFLDVAADSSRNANVKLGPGNDYVVANTALTLDARGGNDLVQATSTRQVTLDGGPGDDALAGPSAGSVLRGGEGDDRLMQTERGLSADSLSGGRGFDVVAYGLDAAALPFGAGPNFAGPGRSAPVTVRLGGSAGNGVSGENDTIADDVEGAVGGNAADLLVGDGNANLLIGWGAGDTIEGGAGDDVLRAKAGFLPFATADTGGTIDPGTGADTVDGAEGPDVIPAGGDAIKDVLRCYEDIDSGSYDDGLDELADDCERGSFTPIAVPTPSPSPTAPPAATASPTPSPPGNPLENAPLPLRCSGRYVQLLEVGQSGRRVRLTGLTLTSFAGQQVTLTASPGGVVGRATVRPDGTFEATVPPPRASVRSRVRYDALVGGRHSLRLKLQRRFVISTAAPGASGTTLNARVTGRRQSGVRVNVYRQPSASCSSA